MPRLEDEYTEIAKATDVPRDHVKRVLMAFWYRAKIDRTPELVELLQEARRGDTGPGWCVRVDEILALFRTIRGTV